MIKSKIILLLFSLISASCISSDPITQAKEAERTKLRNHCMDNVSNDPTPNPVLRTQIIHQCNAWARSKIK